MSRSPSHSFNVELACVYGVDESIMITHFQYWIQHNMRCGKNEHDGRTWSYQTLDEIAAHFDYWTKEQVREIIERLCTGKNRKSKKLELDFEPVLVKGNYNRTPLDRTVWYAFKNEEMFTKRGGPHHEKGRPPSRKREAPNTHIYTTHTRKDAETDRPPPAGSSNYEKEEKVRFGTDHQDFTIEVENEHGFKQSITRDKLKTAVASHSHGLSRKLIDQALAITWTQLKNLDIIPNKLLSYAVGIYKKTVQELTECPKQSSSQKEKHQQHQQKSDSSKKSSSSRGNRKSLYEILKETRKSMGLSLDGEQTPVESSS